MKNVYFACVATWKCSVRSSFRRRSVFAVWLFLHHHLPFHKIIIVIYSYITLHQQTGCEQTKPGTIPHHTIPYHTTSPHTTMSHSPATIALENFLETEACSFPTALPGFETTTLFQALDDDALSFPTIVWPDTDSDGDDSCCSIKTSNQKIAHKKNRRTKYRGGTSRPKSSKVHCLASLA